jgi:isoleucyl-tRNA synthetase
MSKAREFITEGLALRATSKIKVRQPLKSITVPQLPDDYVEVLKEELNVKEVKWGEVVALDTDITKDLRLEGLSRDMVRAVQNARKQAGLEVDDRIILYLSCENELKEAVEKYGEEIKQEVLAENLVEKLQDKMQEFKEEIEGLPLLIGISKHH